MSSSSSNCIVADSDYQAALSAIESTFQSALHHTLDEDDTTVAQMFMEETHESLIESLKRIVQSVSDQEYQAFIDPYHIIPTEDNYESDDDDDDEEEAEEEEEEVDEEDLLDVKAYETAKEKREQVRNLSRRVQQIRQRVLDRVAIEASTDFMVDFNTPIRIETSEDLAADSSEESTSFQTTLQRLNNALNQSQRDNLPKQLQRLQDTIESIQKEQNKDQPLSQTEIAIVSRTNSMADEELMDQCMRLSQQDYDPTGTTERDENRMSPVERLALFFQDYSE